jgi:phosphate acyltransferase
MSSMIRIAIDAMGGDHGPAVVLPGCERALIQHPDVHFVLVGKQAEIETVLAGLPKLKAKSSIVPADVVVRMDDKPSQALRQGRRVSSMWIAVEQVKKGEADVCVSAGNTGALMAMSKFCLRTMANIDRPAIAALWPTMKGESVVLDVGATIGADAQQLVDMAVMGAAMAQVVFALPRPRVGLLNVGVEEIKGVEEVKEAAKILKETPLPGLDFIGFVEGDDIGKGTSDVIVTEGFAGNIALKTAEGTAKQIAGYLRDAMSRTWMAKIGYFFAKGAFNVLREKMDPRRVNGGVFLGLDGIVVKSHGGADAVGFAAAVDLAYNMARQELKKKISLSLSQYYSQPRGTAGVEAQSAPGVDAS